MINIKGVSELHPADNVNVILLLSEKVFLSSSDCWARELILIWKEGSEWSKHYQQLKWQGDWDPDGESGKHEIIPYPEWGFEWPSLKEKFGELTEGGNFLNPNHKLNYYQFCNEVRYSTRYMLVNEQKEEEVSDEQLMSTTFI